MPHLRALPLLAAALAMLALTTPASVRPAESPPGGQTVAKAVAKPAGHKTKAYGKLAPVPPPRPAGIKREPEEGRPPPLPPGRFVPAQSRKAPATTKGGDIGRIPGKPPRHDPPGDFRFFVNNAIGIASASFSQTDEPSLAARDDPQGAKAVFYTGNWYAGVSTNDGGSFGYINPYTLFPASAAGFCCDQRTIYDPGHNLYLWLLQYNTTGGCNTRTPPQCTGNNIYRLAVANGPTAVANSNWCYWDFTPEDLGMPAGMQFDYPHVALSRNFFYFSANAYLSRSLAGTDWRQSSIVRIPLAPLTKCAGYTYNFLNETDHYDLDLAQGATDTLYWASLTNTSSIRVYHWAENSGTIFWNDITVSSWQRASSPCKDPKGVDWCGRAGVGGSSGTGWSNVTTDRQNGTTVGFMWNAAACTDRSKCAYNRPWPYIRVIRLKQSSLSEIDEPDIWNGSYAFQFPAVGVDARGDIGGVMFWGGGTHYPTLVALIWDGFSCNPFSCGWENYGAAASSASNSNWGDYLDTRPHSPKANTWVATGYSYDGKAVTPRFLWFGRDRDRP